MSAINDDDLRWVAPTVPEWMFVAAMKNRLSRTLAEEGIDVPPRVIALAVDDLMLLVREAAAR